MYVVEYSFHSESEIPVVKERKFKKSNPFILFRSEMRKKEQGSIKMTVLSNNASREWKKLSEDEKKQWKRRYELNRDLPNVIDKKDSETVSDQNLIASDVHLNYLTNELMIHSSGDTSFDNYYFDVCCHFCGCFLGVNHEHCSNCSEYFYALNQQIYDSPLIDFSNNLGNGYSSTVLKKDCYLTESLEVHKELDLEDIDNCDKQDYNRH